MPNSSGAAAVASDDTSSSGGLKKGPWTAAEDAILMEYVKRYGEGNWNAVQKNSGLSRCGKSCRLRWANHLRPNLKKGSFSPDEERLILELHAKLGNKWARMAAQLPGRTDNEIKNYWNTRVKRRQRVGLPLYPQDIQNNQSSPFHHHQSAASQSSFITPMSISHPINNSPLLARHSSSPILGFKRFRANTMGYSPPFPAPRTPTLPLSSSLYTNNFSSQFLPPQNFQFDTNNYNFGLPTMLQSGFDPSGLFGPGSAFSVKMELPSSQIDETTPDDSSKFCSSLACTNSGLLDALLQEAEAMGGKDQARQEGHNQKCGAIDEFLNNTQLSNSAVGAKPALGQWDEASSAQSSAGGEIKTEPTLNVINNHVDDDELSSLLSSIPTTTMVSELYYNEGANALTMTDDNIGPSISAANSYMNNELAALCAWNNLPGMSC